MSEQITVIGAGLAGCEAAWQAARQGVSVRLIEMKPQKYSPAHHSPLFAELVCSNSLRSNQLTNAVGLLKAEMSLLGSLIMEAAHYAEVPAGAALAVDRERFSGYITEKIRSNPRIEVVEQEMTALPSDGIAVIATGPLTSDALSAKIEEALGGQLSFFDAAAPIVETSSINMKKAFYASRYNKGEASYLNCPMTQEEYEAFYQALITAQEAPVKDFERDRKVFEGCMPVEEMARRGYQTLLYGPMKPVGLIDPHTGCEPYACVQLRQENLERTMYNIVGFQTHLTFPEQRRVFGMIPGLEEANFLRYGVMHRNTFLHSPNLLDPCYGLKSRPGIYFAGQMTGVEGYLESASSGFVAGYNAARRAQSRPEIPFSPISVIGALAHYVSGVTKLPGEFQPMNANFGIVPPLTVRVKGGKAARNQALSERSLAYLGDLRGTLFAASDAVDAH